MKLNKYDFYSTVIGILLFIVVAALVALIMSCGSVKPTQPVFDDWGEIKPWQYGAIVEPECNAVGDNMVEWHGYLIIDVSDSLIVIKNQ